MSDAIGIMEGAYFVSRKDCLDWLNGLLGLSYTKVEQVCSGLWFLLPVSRAHSLTRTFSLPPQHSGAAFCQVMDAIYPGKVPLHKVNFGAKLPHEMIQNFKVLQTIFDKVGVGKVIDVDKLIQGKMQDNLEFLQWMKRFFDTHYPGGEYNGPERRKAGGAVDSSVVSAPPPTTQKPKQPRGGAAAGGPGAKKAGQATSGPGAKQPPSAAKAKAHVPPPPTHSTDSGAPSAPATAAADAEGETTSVKVSELAQLKFTVESYERERDFYLSKLHAIEELCRGLLQNKEKNPAPLNSALESITTIMFVPHPPSPRFSPHFPR